MIINKVYSYSDQLFVAIKIFDWRLRSHSRRLTPLVVVVVVEARRVARVFDSHFGFDTWKVARISMCYAM